MPNSAERVNRGHESAVPDIAPCEGPTVPDDDSPAEQTPPRHAGFVMSAGRTGTVFLAKALQRRFAESYIEHEPTFSRYEMMLGNFRNRTGLGGGVLRWAFVKSRKARLKRLKPGSAYIEINPFLCSLADLLPEIGSPFRVLHLVREPVDWTRSILTFKASPGFRPFIDLVPFAEPCPHPWPAGWTRKDRLVRALWRWRYCNEQIRALGHCSEAYAVIRYEDLFSESGHQAALATLLSTLSLPPAMDFDWIDIGERVNAAPSAVDQTEPIIDPAIVESICGTLRREFGYA